jgi:steroid 5-alpha reductase family enzyme
MTPLAYWYYAVWIILIMMAIALPWILYYKKLHVFDVFWGINIAVGIIALSVYASVRPLIELAIPLLLIAAWGARLSLFLLYTRILPSHSDRRYQALSKNAFYSTILKQGLIQGALQTGLIMTGFPLIVTAPVLPVVWVGGILVSAIALVLESLADWQLHQHKQTHTGLCQTGLWRYSRHPNYFFEWVFWMGIGSLYIPHSSALVALVGPTTLFIVMYFITGPYTERLSAAKHGKSFELLCQSTPYFFPRRPKNRAN